MRRISPATITVAVFAIILGLVAAFFTKRAMVEKPVELVREEQGERVVVARQNLEKHDRIVRQILTHIRLDPGEKRAENVITNRDVAVGRYVTQNIEAGTPITSDMLFEIGNDPRSTFRKSIRKGMRAKTVNIAGLIHGSTLVKAGARVDISITVETNHPQIKAPDLKGILTKTLLKSIHVIGVVRPQERYRDRMRNELTTVIVEVTPDQSDVLTLAQQIGTLTMSLIGPQGSDEGGSEDIISPNELLALVNPPPPEPPVPPEPPAPPFRAEHYHGTRVQQIEFGPEKILESRATTAVGQHRGGESQQMMVGPESHASEGLPTQREPSDVTASDHASFDGNGNWEEADALNLQTHQQIDPQHETQSSFVTTLDEFGLENERTSDVRLPRQVPHQQPHQDVSSPSRPVRSNQTQMLRKDFQADQFGPDSASRRLTASSQDLEKSKPKATQSEDGIKNRSGEQTTKRGEKFRQTTRRSDPVRGRIDDQGILGTHDSNRSLIERAYSFVRDNPPERSLYDVIQE